MIVTSFWQVVGATIVSFILFHLVLYSLTRLVDNISRQNLGQNEEKPDKPDIPGEDFNLSMYRLGKNGKAIPVKGDAMSSEELTKIIDALRVARAKAEEDEEASDNER